MPHFVLDSEGEQEAGKKTYRGPEPLNLFRGSRKTLKTAPNSRAFLEGTGASQKLWKGLPGAGENRYRLPNTDTWYLNKVYIQNKSIPS